MTRFAVTVIFWLPLCFAAWYFLSILFVAPIASILDAAMTTVWPDLIAQIEQDGNRLLVTLQLALQQSAQAPPRPALIKFHLHPLDYCYGIALYSALVLASTQPDGARLIKWIIGVLLLFVVAMMGIAAQMIEVIIFQTLPQVGAPADWSPAAYHTAAIAYKMTYLVLTPVAPIAIWIAQFREQLTTIIGAASGERVSAKLEKKRESKKQFPPKIVRFRNNAVARPRKKI